MPDLPVIKRSDIVIDSKSRIGEGQFVRSVAFASYEQNPLCELGSMLNLDS